MRFDGDDTERNFIALTGGEIARFCVAMLILSKTMSKVGRSDSHTGRGRILTQCGLLGGGSGGQHQERGDRKEHAAERCAHCEMGALCETDRRALRW